MNGWLIGGVVGLATAGWGCGAEPGPKEGPKAAWMSDYAEARAASAKSGKPIFVVFR